VSKVYSDVPCPKCSLRQSHVVDSRGTKAGAVRRRRQCACGLRYTTYEHLGVDPTLLLGDLHEVERLVRMMRVRLRQSLSSIGEIAE
jgi:transcriptional regulator NrdR family protein